MSVSPGQDDVITLVTNNPRPEPMDESMVVRTDDTEIPRTVVFHLGDPFDVMNLDDGACRTLIIPLGCGVLSSVTTINLAPSSHQANDHVSQAGRARQPLVRFPSARLTLDRVNLLQNAIEIPARQLSVNRT
ncbi:hypothetical protein [Candidatus Palauibacter sp.]|uniref:hypothetical protein n=1 Tax=Candidatus Palauibacter sp. TaxID=3101350 RepID=UPI003B011A64